MGYNTETVLDYKQGYNSTRAEGLQVSHKAGRVQHSYEAMLPRSYACSPVVLQVCRHSLQQELGALHRDEDKQHISNI
jgi:hypothetical protein